MQNDKKYLPKVKLAVAFCVAVMLIFSSCGAPAAEDKIKTTAKTTAATTAAPTTESPYVVNPLTGENTLVKSMKDKRPVAVMINNIKVAQEVQASVGKADLVFETLVEGGITRLMAVYSDISKIGQIGTVRSARYSYAQLACGLDARYVHCGSDNKYCTPLMNELDLDHLDLGGNASSASKRISNGLAYEHTLYTYGDKLSKLYNDGRTKIRDSAKNPFSFSDKAQKYETAAEKVAVKMSGDYTTTFTYDAKAKKYTRGDKVYDAFYDCVTDAKEQFTNVIVMFTDIYSFSDGHHMKSELDSGSGYYFSNGTKCAIKWEKGKSSSPLKFYDESGKSFKLNKGNSYILITDSDNKSGCTYQ